MRSLVLKLSRPSERALDGLAVLAIPGLVLIFNPDLAFRGMVPSGYDTFVYFYPYRAYVGQALAEGRLPLWNPHLFLGVPLLANPQAAVFYPGTLLFAFLPVPQAYALNFLGHLFLGGVGMYGFVRRSVGTVRGPAVLGAAAFVFGGYVSGHAGHINQISAIAWLPLAALALDLGLRGGGLLAVAALVATLALQLLAGHPQQVYMTLVVLGLVVAWRRWGDGLAALLRGWVMLGLAAALAFGLAAAQLLPTAELARESIRGGGVSYEQATWDALPWQLVLPALLPGYWTTLHTTELFGHLGAVVFALGWIGLLAGSTRPAVLGGLLVLLGLVLALGDGTPLYRWLFDWAPGFGSFRAPARWLFVYSFGAALLVAVGLDRVVRGRGSGVGGRRTSFAWSRVLLIGIGVPLALGWLVFYGERQPRLLLLIWVGLAAATVVLALTTLLARRLRGPIVALLLVGGLVELWLAGANLEHRRPMPDLAFGQPRESTALLRERLGADRRFRMLSIATPEYVVKETLEYEERFADLGPAALENLLVAVKWNETLVPNVPLGYRLDTADGYDGGVLPLASYVRLTEAMLPGRARLDGALASRLDALPEDRWLDLLGVRYVLASRIKDLSVDGLLFDRAVTATLRPGERRELTGLPLGEFTRLGLLSSFRGPSRAGQVVAELELDDGAGRRAKVALLDGVHTAATDAVPVAGGRLERTQAWGAESPNDGADWVGRVEVPRQELARLTIVNPTGDLVFDLRSLNLVDDVRQASFSINPDSRIERTDFFDVKLYERLDALPRAYVADRADVVDDAAALERLADPAFQPRRGVLLAPGDGARALPPLGSGAGTATLELDRPEQVRLRVGAPGGAFVVLSDSWYPGWRATVDGADVPIARANVLFRAVEVPVGEHTVEFRYEPTSFRLGLAVSAASLLAGLALWAGAAGWGRRRQVRP